jgi:TolB protein
MNKTQLTWSPDGNRLVFADNRSGSTNVFAMNTDGTGLVQLVDQVKDVYKITWSPDSKWIAYTQASPDGGNLYISRQDGSKTIILAKDFYIRSFCFSPDSRSLIFSGATLTGKIDDQLYSIKIDGSALRKLTDSGRNLVNFWLTDNKHVSFTSNRDGTWQLYQMTSDGTDQIRITQNESSNFPVGLSPDGNLVAMISDQDGFKELYILDSDGSNQKKVTTLKQEISQVWWSPDGKYFSISSNLDNNFDPNNWKTWIVSVDGTSQLDVTGYTGLNSVSWRP